MKCRSIFGSPEDTHKRRTHLSFSRRFLLVIGLDWVELWSFSHSFQHIFLRIFTIFISHLWIVRRIRKKMNDAHGYNRSFNIYMGFFILFHLDFDWTVAFVFAKSISLNSQSSSSGCFCIPNPFTLPHLSSFTKLLLLLLFSVVAKIQFIKYFFWR